MHLNDWEIHLYFDEREDAANNVTMPRYRCIECNYNIPKLIAKGEDIEEHVVHELAHAYTWRLWELGDLYANGDKYMTWMIKDLYEEATTLIAWSLLKTKSLEQATVKL